MRFPEKRESRAGWKRWKQRSKKLINFFLFFFLNKKKKNGSTASTFYRVSPLLFLGEYVFWLWLDGVVLAIYS